MSPAGQSPPHVPAKPCTPQGSSAPVQPQTSFVSGTHSRAFAQPPKHEPSAPPQSGKPSVVVVYVGHTDDVVTVEVVLEVVGHVDVEP